MAANKAISPAPNSTAAMPVMVDDFINAPAILNIVSSPEAGPGSIREARCPSLLDGPFDVPGRISNYAPHQPNKTPRFSQRGLLDVRILLSAPGSRATAARRCW